MVAGFQAPVAKRRTLEIAAGRLEHVGHRVVADQALYFRHQGEGKRPRPDAKLDDFAI